MRTRPLGTTGIEVSEVGLGAWQLDNAIWNGPDESSSLGLVEEALALGCTFFDTAPGYGDGRSEEILGKALAGRRDEVVLCTKFGHGPGGTTDFSPEQIQRSLEQSLRRLGTDRIEVLLLHNPPPELLDGAAPHYDELERLRERGLLRVYGVSLDWSTELDAVLENTRCGAVEVLFNAFHQEPLEAMRRAAAKGVGVIVKVPLDSGWLSGKYGASSSFDDVRDRWSAEVLARRGELLSAFEELVPAGSTVPATALAYVLAQECVSTVIPGAKSLEQLRANIAAADLALEPARLEAIRQLWRDRLEGEPLPW